MVGVWIDGEYVGFLVVNKSDGFKEGDGSFVVGDDDGD